MKILFVGLEFDPGTLKAANVVSKKDTGRGHSFEYQNFYLSLRGMTSTETELFPLERIKAVGKRAFNEELITKIKQTKPDVVFCFMYTDELEPETLDRINKETSAITLGWFSDDHWRFDNYSRRYAKHFKKVVTTYSKAVDWYKKISVTHVIHSQWAANTTLYKPMISSVASPDTVFVGTWSAPREKLISNLAQAKVSVQTFGGGWSSGRVSQDEMLRLFSTSKINLGLNPQPSFFNMNSIGRLLFRRSFDKAVPDFHLYQNLMSWLHRGIPQIKARHFEIPACGGFLVTAQADNLSDYYMLGKEIIVYESTADLIDKIQYYVAHDSERQAIAKAGYERTLRDHTYEKRFKAIFDEIF